jgi:putative tricarboxylic transport membrane protein
MDALLAGFDLILTPQVMIALLVGSIGGVIIGAIPGVGAAVAIAILLPATFSLEPIVGLTMLLGIYGSSIYGGFLPAILINTPGTAVNALTTYDGHPMTKRGEALRALGLAYGASFFSGIASILALILLSPVLAKVAPMFGSREIFLAALLGIVLVVIAHRGQTMAAGSLAAFGIFIGTMGLEPVKYTQRRLIPFDPAAQDVVLHGLPIQDVLVLFYLCQPDGKMTDRCPARRSTRVFPMRKRARSIWRTDGGRTASFAPLAAPARAGL